MGYKTPTEKLREEIPFSEITFGSLKSLKSYSENKRNI
ncbi:hypothetical protein FCR2A7T_07270 [Flavobacterium cauense R2A-7]|nr:hypothetical protein FCR2A7T_07270 [Flavobacterium cauense R2A-7]